MQTSWRAALAAVFLSTLVSSPAARDDEGSSVEMALLDVLLQRGIIDAATYEELVALSERERAEEEQLALLEARLNRLAAPDVVVTGGRPGRLAFASEDGKWSLNLKGRLQVQGRYQSGESGNRTADEINFAVARGRIGAEGQAGHERLTYKFEIDGATQNRVNAGAKSFAVKDAYLNWSVQKDEGSRTDFRAGQFKFPFGREIHAKSTRLATVEGSIASDEFAPNREPGLMLASDLMDDKLQLFVGLSNGEREGGANQDGQDGSSSTGLRRGVRVVLHPLGKVAEDMSAFGGQGKNGAWETRFAVGASYMVNADQPRDVDGVGGVGDARSDDTTVGLEAQVVSGPLSLVYERFDRKADVDNGAPDIDDDGHSVLLAYQIVPSLFEVVAAVSEIDFEGMDDLRETTLGFNYFLDKHNSKLMFDISKRENRTTADSDSTRVRGQYQVVF